MKGLLMSIMMVLVQSLVAQSILFNSSGGTPDPSALMELRSKDKGFLSPRMEESDRLAITSPAQGLLVFQTNGTVGFYFYNGTSWDTLAGATTVNNISNVTNISSSGITVIRDLKSASVDGGSFVSGSWQTRDLNDYQGDSSYISLSGNEFKLDSGVYVITARAPAFEVSEHQIRLYNVTSGSVEAVGVVAFSDKFAASESTLTTVVSVGSTSQKFKLEHRCSDTKNDDGFGIGASWGDNVYSQIEVQQL